MNILLVYAHPNPRSFNRALLETIDAELCERGHATCIRDLYQMRFRAVLDGEDLIRNWRGDLPDDIRQEQEAIRWAQGLVFIYPIWWFGPPAILKGWIDRVFVRKFAFDFTEAGMQGLLTHEKALIVNTLGGDEATLKTCQVLHHGARLEVRRKGSCLEPGDTLVEVTASCSSLTEIDDDAHAEKRVD